MRAFEFMESDAEKMADLVDLEADAYEEARNTFLIKVIRAIESRIE